jgi:hypothetical protein
MEESNKQDAKDILGIELIKIVKTSYKEPECRGNHLQAIKKLIADGANVNYQETLQNSKVNIKAKSLSSTALHFAALYKLTDVVKILIKSGPNVNLKNKYGMTALSLIDSSKELTELLFANGATVTPMVQHNFQIMDTYQNLKNKAKLETQAAFDAVKKLQLPMYKSIINGYLAPLKPVIVSKNSSLNKCC